MTREANRSEGAGSRPIQGQGRSTAALVLGAALVLVAALLAVGATTAQAQPVPLKVMTWNGKTSVFGPHDWVKVIANQRPEILGMQEVCVREVEELRDLLHDEGLEYTVTLGSVRQGFYPGCGTFPLVGEDPVARRNPDIPGVGSPGAYGQAVLTLLPVVPGSGVNERLPSPYAGAGEDDEERGYMALTVDAPGRGPVRVYDTHLATKGQNRRAQIDRIVGEAASHPRAIVLGDLNTNPSEESTVLGALPREGFGEADASRAQKTGGNDWRAPGSAAARKIDWIWSRGLAAVPGSTRTFWTASSDHRPLMTDLSSTP